MRRILRLVNEISFGWMLVALLATIAGFAAVYLLLARIDPTLVHETYTDGGTFSLFDALYFSIVTITSLGYGDIRPEGIARLVVGFEVVIGLSFFGLMIAKISSIRQDYILRRIYYADMIDRKLDGYSDQLAEYRKLYRITSNMLLDGEIDPELTTTFQAEVAETTLFYQVHSLLQEIDTLIRFELSNGRFFGEASDSLMSQIYASIQSMMRHTLSIYERDSERACRYVVCGNERWILELTEIAEDMARIGGKHSKNDDLIEQCDSILALGADLRTNVLDAIEPQKTE